jgi:hypothetical protein
MTISIMSIVAVISIIVGVIYATLSMRKARRDTPEGEDFNPWPRKLTKTKIGIYIAGGGLCVFLLSMFGILH